MQIQQERKAEFRKIYLQHTPRDNNTPGVDFNCLDYLVLLLLILDL
jgi:hypothetical protein